MNQISQATEQDLASKSRDPSVGKASVWIALLLTLVPVLCLAVPMYVIRPFRPQEPSQLAAALTIRGLGPWLSAIAALGVLVVVLRAWRKTARLWLRAVLVALCVIAFVGACLTNVNIFEIMFHPYTAPSFSDAGSSQVDSDDKVLAVTINGEAHAYPIRTMGYHHIVNDTVGNIPVAATYCTLCHTGLVWNRLLNGTVLHFRLAGINNGNALIRDEETSTIWQQSTGQAIFGPLKGQQLGLIHSDELTFALWRKEQPRGLVLKPDTKYASEYDPKDWEKHVERTRTVIDTSRTGIPPHELMLGITTSGQSKAYPVRSIAAVKLIQDHVAGVPILILVGPDAASIRVFKGRSSDSPSTFVSTNAAPGPGESVVMRDLENGSDWNFKGCAVAGRLAGQCLESVDANKDYWFDWLNHHPDTLVLRP